MKIQYLHPEAKPPTKNPGDAGYDLTSVEEVTIPPMERRLVKTGLALAIPSGYYGHISDRSGLALKHGLHCLGKIVDSTYRGELGVILLNTDEKPYSVQIGDRIAQIIFHRYETMVFTEAELLPPSIRGAGGYGSTGR